MSIQIGKFSIHIDDTETVKSEPHSIYVERLKNDYKDFLSAPRETLAAVCGVSPKSSGYTNNLGRLRTAGLIDYPQAGKVAPASEGRKLANPPVDSGRPLYKYWLDIVTNPQRNILSALIEAHPKPVQRDNLAEGIGVSPNSSGYTNNLGRLRTLGAIDYPSPGMVALTQYVMP